MANYTASFAALAEVVSDLDATLLSGWPHDTYPSDDEAEAIESVFNELSLAEPTIDESRRWYLAGQIVARIKRDRSR